MKDRRITHGCLLFWPGWVIVAAGTGAESEAPTGLGAGIRAIEGESHPWGVDETAVVGSPGGMAGDPRNSSEFLMSHAGFVRSLARRLLADEAEVEDLVQETLLRAIESGPRRREALPAWLRAVTRNLAFKRLRGRARVRQREELVARTESLPSTADLFERQDSLQRVVKVVLDLPEHYRQVVLLRFFEDLPPRKIAVRLALPVGTVRMRLHRALKLVRGKLDQEYGGDRERWTLALGLLAGVPKVAKSAAVASPMTLGVMVLLGLLGAALVGLLGIGGSGQPRAPVVRTADARGEAHGDGTDGLATSGPPAGRSALDAPTTDAGEAAAAEPGVALAVLVVDGEGEPVGNARVLGQWAGEAWSVRARTDSWGRATLRPPPKATRAGLYLAARARGFGPASVVNWSDGLGLPVPFVLRLREGGAALRGRVLDPAGRPVPGARVVVGQSFRLGLGHLGAYVLDELGNAPPLLPGLAVAPGQASYQGDLRVRGFLGPQLLTAGGVVERLPPGATTRTGAAGRFELDGLEAGELPVRVVAAGYSVLSTRVSLADQVATELELHLVEGAQVEGVLRRADGLPLRSGSVYALGEGALGEGMRRGARVGQDGVFKLSGLPAGAYALYACGPGGADGFDCELVAGETLRWAPQLNGRRAIRGRVTDPEGAALAGWRVELRVFWNPGRAVDKAVTSGDGSFVIAGCPPVEAALYLLPPDTFDATPVLVREVSGGDLLDPWVVPRERLTTGRLSATLLDPSGLPLPEDTRVMLHGSGYGAAVVVRLDSRGRFVSPPLPGGDWRWCLAGYGQGFMAEHSFELIGADLDLGEVRLGGTGRLRLTGEPGLVTLGLTRLAGEGYRLTTFKGRARLPLELELAPGRWEVALGDGEPRVVGLVSGGVVEVEVGR
jgi:RNA polymerase sigma factor (sigma-70 family)